MHATAPILDWTILIRGSSADCVCIACLPEKKVLLKGLPPAYAPESIPYSASKVTCMILLAAALMSDVYEDHKDEDGFLYITYSGENTFGC